MNQTPTTVRPPELSDVQAAFGDTAQVVKSGVRRFEVWFAGVYGGMVCQEATTGQWAGSHNIHYPAGHEKFVHDSPVDALEAYVAQFKGPQSAATSGK